MDWLYCCGNLLKMNLLTVSCNLVILALVLAFVTALLYENVGPATQQVVEYGHLKLLQGQ